MASKSRSGLTKEGREKFLRDNGFVEVRSGKGSHELWEHTELKLLARTHKIAPPANVLSNPAQKPWETTLCGDPAGGTWRGMVKHAEWCQGTVAMIKEGSESDRQRCKIVSQFRKASDDMRRWKKAVNHHLKTGLAADSAPKAPMGNKEFQELKSKKIQLSTPVS